MLVYYGAAVVAAVAGGDSAPRLYKQAQWRRRYRRYHIVPL